MTEFIKKQIKHFQEQGIPLFFVKDPVTKLPSVSLTLLVVSFTLCVLSLLNKFAKVFDGVDVENTLELLVICASLYFGRALSKKMNNGE